MHTMHEARAPLAPGAAAAGLPPLGCSLTRRAHQIVKHFNSTEQGIKNYMHRHVRACGRTLRNCADAALRCACAGNHGDQGARFVLAVALAATEPAVSQDMVQSPKHEWKAKEGAAAAHK